MEFPTVDSTAANFEILQAAEFTCLTACHLHQMLLKVAAQGALRDSTTSTGEEDPASRVTKYACTCRCIPTLPPDVQAKVSVSTSGINSFYNTASTRLRRYLADIGKAKWLIIVSGKHCCHQQHFSHHRCKMYSSIMQDLHAALFFRSARVLQCCL